VYGFLHYVAYNPLHFLCLQCHHMLEANEAIIETWWFKHYAKGIDTDLNDYLCVNRMKGKITFCILFYILHVFYCMFFRHS
jgi:TLR4 regulator and MIR-interacting MSAP